MTMKRLLFLALFFPTLIWAQDNSKYLAGAVTEDDGKVVFTEEINVPALSSTQIFNTMLDWADKYFTKDDSRVVYSDPQKGDIAAVGKEYLVFQSTALSLDRTMISYKVTIKCENQKCILKVNGIRYEYNVSYQREPEKYIAEEWITDKYALNKNKTKLNRGNGKFRTKTIDFVDAIFKEASAALGIQAVQAVPAVQAQQAAPAQVPAAVLTPAIPAKEGYIAFAADKVPSTLLQMLPESNMEVTQSAKSSRKETGATWKGTGNMFGKSIASISISADSPVHKEIGDNGMYSLSFFKKGESGDAWLIIDCRKQGETADGQQMTIIGEILNVWMK